MNTALNPALNESPSYGQLFIVDLNEATESRLKDNIHLHREILQSLDHIIRNINIFAKSFRMMGEATL